MQATDYHLNITSPPPVTSLSTFLSATLCCGVCLSACLTACLSTALWYGVCLSAGFSLAKRLPYTDAQGSLLNKTFTVCGTAEYLAPEVVVHPINTIHLITNHSPTHSHTLHVINLFSRTSSLSPSDTPPLSPSDPPPPHSHPFSHSLVS